MLFWFGLFIFLNEIDHVILPDFNFPFSILVRYLIENIVKIIHRIDDFSDVSLLECCDLRVQELVCLEQLTVCVSVAINTVNVVVGIIGMCLFRFGVLIYAPAFKEHY